MNKIDVNLDKKLNEIIKYIAIKYENTNNTKPVLLHSIRVGFNLYKYGYSEDIIIAGFLHDLLEDTSTTYSELKNKFGEKIANIVLNVSFNKNIGNYIEKTKDMFIKCLKNKESSIVKCADLLDNFSYVNFADNDLQEKLLVKYNLFLDMFYDSLRNEKIYKELNKKIKNKA